MSRAKIIVFLLLFTSVAGLSLIIKLGEPPYYDGDVYYSYRVSISEDGSYIVVSDWDTMLLFSQYSAAPLWAKKVSFINQVEISADGEYIVGATGGGQGSINLMKNNGDTVWTYYSNSQIQTVAISDNGDYIVAGTSNGVYLFTKDDNVPRWSYLGNEASSVTRSYYGSSWLQTVAISDNGDYIVAAAVSGVYFFTPEDNVSRWSYLGGEAYSVAISDNGDYIVAGTSNGVYLFTKDDNVPRWSYLADGASFVVISADGSDVVAATDLGSGRGKNIHIFTSNNNTPIWSRSSRISIQPMIASDGKYLAFTDLGYWLYVYDRVENAVVTEVSDTNIFGKGNIGSISMSSDGNYIALGVDSFGSGKESGFVALFSVPENRVVWVY